MYEGDRHTAGDRMQQPDCITVLVLVDRELEVVDDVIILLPLLRAFLQYLQTIPDYDL